MPFVTEPVDEPLVPIDHPRIVGLPAYLAAGWEHARPELVVRRGVLARLAAAAESLPATFGLCVFDAWRPLALQTELYEHAYGAAELPAGFLAPPSSDPTAPPPHLSGGSVDCSLTVDGIPLALGTAFDDFTPRAAADAIEAEPGVDRELRRLLYWTMRAHGFVVLTFEWWHFEHGTRRWAALTGGAPRYGSIEL